MKKSNAPGLGITMILLAGLLLCFNSHARQARPMTAAELDANAVIHPEPIRLNTAGYWQLRCLPDINDEKARAILQYRAEQGGFGSPKELLEVEGITENIWASVWLQVELGTYAGERKG